MILGIYGASGLGREILELALIINSKEHKWDDFVFIDDGDVPPIVSGKPVYKYEVAKKEYGSSLEIAMGIGEPTTRGKIFQKLLSDGINTPTLIHPNVYVPDSVRIGKGVIIQDGCFISVDISINNYALLQPRCSVGHDCVLGEGCVISTFDSIAGAVQIGKYTYIGMSVAIRELIHIGDYSIIGMGSIVVKDIPDEVIAIGNPARPMKKNEDHRVFGH